MTHACYFCQQEIEERPEDSLCSGCGVYICEGDEFGCSSRISPFGRSKHRPEEHVVPCGTCGEGRCDCACGVCGEEGCGSEEHRVRYHGFEQLPPPPRVPSVAEIEKAIGIKARDWNGRCHEIAKKLLTSGLVSGVARYGLYWGNISGKSKKFGGRAITHHGWVERPDRTIVDPTRWAFEASKPYVWSGWNSGEYDFGGSAIYEDHPLPKVTASDKTVEIEIDEEARAFVMQLLSNPPRLTKSLLIWLSHRSPDALGRHARPIYQALVDAKLGAYLQHDMRVAVLGGQQ